MEAPMPKVRKISAEKISAAAFETVFVLEPREEAYFRDNLAEQMPTVAARIEANENDLAKENSVDSHVLRLTLGDAKVFVVKIIDKSDEANPPWMLNTLVTAGWPTNVVRYHAVLDTSQHRFVLMDDCAAGDLEMQDGADSLFSEDGLRCLMRGALTGLCALHDCRLVHCDIKTANILCAETSLEAFHAPSIDADTQKQLSASIKLVDLSEVHEVGQTRGDVGTARAPEIWKQICEYIQGDEGKTWTAEEIHETEAFDSLCPATPAEDSWALGAVFYELSDNEDLFDPDEIYEIVAKGDYPALCEYYAGRIAGIPEAFQNRNLSDGSLKFLQGLLSLDPCERLTAHAALKDAWLA